MFYCEHIDLPTFQLSLIQQIVSKSILFRLRIFQKWYSCLQL